MRVHKVSKACLVPLTIVLLNGCPGGFPGPPGGPPPTVDKVINSMEYSSQSVVVQYLDVLGPDLFSIPNAVLGTTAGIGFNWIPRVQSLPSPGQGSGDQFPSITTQSQFYVDYALANMSRNSGGPSTYGFHTFFVRSYAPNGAYTGTCPAGLFGASAYTDNVPYADPLYRWTFVFIEDSFSRTAGCKDSHNVQVNQKNFVVHVTTHEMGHQRGGLTHANEAPNYHSGQYGSVPNYKVDVMTDLLTSEIMALETYPAFDMSAAAPVPLDGTTCQGILAKWKTITQ